ncbi:MAG TPA: hypothetical protein ENH05_05985 [Rhizobiales bacterium]|nr:hypothetical protein BMS3Bbin10_01018 [bacterium BMS3Bbin10]HDO52271.1 hypothetical protein [Hyphomicrobiales bacterium]
MLKTIPILLAFGLISGPALAAQMEMSCENPRREYLATFDETTNTFKVQAEGADSFYIIKRIEDDGNGLILRGKTIKGGPDFAAYLGAKKRIEFIDGGEVIQTDPCK